MLYYIMSFYIIFFSIILYYIILFYFILYILYFTIFIIYTLYIILFFQYIYISIYNIFYVIYIYMMLDDFGGTPPFFFGKKYIYIHRWCIQTWTFCRFFYVFQAPGMRIHIYIYIYIIWINKEINKFTPSIGPVSKTVSKSQRFSRSPQVERIPRFGSTGCEPFEHLYEALGIPGIPGKGKKLGHAKLKSWKNVCPEVV